MADAAPGPSSDEVEYSHLIQHLAVAHDLNAVDLRALKFLGATDEDRTPKELGAYLEMGTSAVTGLLDRLTKRGFLTRVQNPSDRRSVRIELTPDGFAVVGVIRSAYRAALQRALPDSDVERFIEFASHVALAFRDASTAGPDGSAR